MQQALDTAVMADMLSTQLSQTGQWQMLSQRAQLLTVSISKLSTLLVHLQASQCRHPLLSQPCLDQLLPGQGTIEQASAWFVISALLFRQALLGGVLLCEHACL